MSRLIKVLTIAAFCMSSAGGAAASDVAADPANIRAHMAYLADDRLQGREAGTIGEAAAAGYINSVMHRLGLEPMNGTRFLQTVPLRTGTLGPTTIRMKISEPGGDVVLDSDDAVMFADLHSETTDVTAEAVFAGHGVTAPRHDMDDYAALDVTEKFVVVLDGSPSFLPAAAASFHGSTARKRDAAERAGAIGLIRLRTAESRKQRDWKSLRSYAPYPFTTWRSEYGTATGTGKLRGGAIVRRGAAAVLFSQTDVDPDALLERAEDGPVKGMPLNIRLRLSSNTTHDDSKSSLNVGGLVTGHDPSLADEIVVITAHYDHVGVCRGEEAKDRICNGALDNAFGTAAMLDVARRFAANGPARRSVLFLAVGAEEKGLLGSDYFNVYPLTQGRKIVANINMDGGLPFYDFSDVIAFGAEDSQLQDHLQTVARGMGLSVAADPFPELNLFMRSDHFSFIKRGVPSIFLYQGLTDMDGEAVGRAYWDDFMANRYHQPSDDMDQPFDDAALRKYSDIFYRLTRSVADADAAPRWQTDSEVGAIYAPEASKVAR